MLFVQLGILSMGEEKISIGKTKPSGGSQQTTQNGA
jgi:hypothetical protein